MNRISHLVFKKTQKDWLKQKANISEKQLIIKGFQVMQRWEDNYMDNLASVATSKGGNILEVGFGMGISASYIQKSAKIKTHTIIECHPQVIQHAGKMFKSSIAKGRMTLINGFWEHVTFSLKDELFTGILFDSSPLGKETEFFHYFPFFKEAYRLLKSGGVFTYFSDEPKEISKRHLIQLRSAGFSNIRYSICHVNPPQSCRYWKHNTIVTPIVIK